MDLPGSWRVSSDSCIHQQMPYDLDSAQRGEEDKITGNERKDAITPSGTFLRFDDYLRGFDSRTLNSENSSFELLDSQRDVIQRFYSIISLIDYEGYSQVYWCLDKSCGEECVIRIMSKSVMRLLHESAEAFYYTHNFLFRNLNKHVLKYRRLLEDAEKYYIITDTCPGPTLLEVFLSYLPRTLPLYKVRMIMLKVLSALDFLHSNHMVHRNIKFENLVYKESKSIMGLSPDKQGADSTEGPVAQEVATNFVQQSKVNQDSLFFLDLDTVTLAQNDSLEPPATGSSKQKKSDSFQPIPVGTPQYMAPEVYSGHVGTTNDMWSCGVLLYAMLDGSFPFPITESMHQTLRQEILEEDQPYMDPFVWDDKPKAADLCIRLLDPNPKNRLKTAKDALSHPFFLSK